MTIRIGRAATADLGGEPLQEIGDGPQVGSVALLGSDWPGLRPRFAVAEGERVGAGQALFTDHARPQIAFVSPIDGVVEAIRPGPRRTLSSLTIRASPADEGSVIASVPDLTTSREALLSRGLWPAFLTRPFGRIPVPDAEPEAIFVTATDTNPLAPDPRVVLAGREGTFHRGVEVLATLTSGPIFVCQSPGPDLVAATDRIRTSTFSGPHPSGLAGTHILKLHPVAEGGEVWTIGYQDVIAVGHLFQTGRYLPDRVVALAGPRAARPRLVRTVLGANLRDLVSTELTPGRPPRLVSGSLLSGRAAAYLGRYHAQLILLDDLRQAGRSGPRSSRRPIIPFRALDRALPRQIPPVPLMRALSVGDTETAARLGCRHLLEEDVALLSSLCTSGADYSALLRHVLDELAENE